MAVGTTKTITGIFCEVVFYWLNIIFGNFLKIKQLQEEMKRASTYEEWIEKRLEFEKLKGINKWKHEMPCDDYDFELIHSRLLQLQTARELNDMAAASFLLRTSIARNFAGISNPKLYIRSQCGTKKLIEDFVEEIVLQLRAVSTGIEELESHVEIRRQIEFFKTLRHSLGNTALLLSGGGSLGVYHVGVLKAVIESGMLPRIIAGSSAGSIIAGLMCIHTEDEFSDLLCLNTVNYNFIEPELLHKSWYADISRKFGRFFRTGVIYDQKHMKSVLKENFGDITFLEAFQKTERVLNITVSSSTSYEMPCLLNYITAPDVMVWSAILASCAVPGCFPAVQLLAKMGPGEYRPWHGSDSRWIDGSVENDIPMKKLAELFNVNHFIVCQVNPHIYPFVALSPRESMFGSIYEKIFYLITSELQYRLRQLYHFGILRKFCYYMLNLVQQPYQGDITIVPKLAVRDMIRMLTDLDKNSVNEAITRGLHAAWPKVSSIRYQCMVEMTLDDILFRLRKRLNEVTGPRNSVDSLLEHLTESNILLSCSPSLSKSVEQFASVGEIETLLADGQSVKSFPDSVLFQQQEEEKPPEFSKPRLRAHSLSYSSYNNIDT